jgi:lipid-A-disaccharide synthase
VDQPSHPGQDAPLLMVAAEASGDQHGAALVRALRERFPQLQVYGLGGDHMRAAGVETLFDVQALNVVGVVEILAKVPSGLRMAHQLLRAAARRGTQVAVLIDAPGFNLTFARLAKRAGLSVVYYISPQIWAWRQSRVKRVARSVDKMLTLFPFEVPFYTAASVDAEYVGHPLLDHLHHLPTPTQAARSLGLDAQAPIVALLPGSRRQELRSLLPTMLAAFQRIRQRLPGVQGIIPVAPTLTMDEVQQFLTHYPMPLTVISGQSHTVLCAAHFALVASGTATLEAGLIGTPMVVVYKMHPITAWLARRVLCIPYIGLVNIVAGRPVVPELLQEALCPQTLSALALHCLEHPEVAQHVRHELALLHQTLGTGEGARRAAACVGQFLRAAETRAAATVQG